MQFLPFVYILRDSNICGQTFAEIIKLVMSPDEWYQFKSSISSTYSEIVWRTLYSCQKSRSKRSFDNTSLLTTLFAWSEDPSQNGCGILLLRKATYVLSLEHSRLENTCEYWTQQRRDTYWSGQQWDMECLDEHNSQWHKGIWHSRGRCVSSWRCWSGRKSCLWSSLPYHVTNSHSDGLAQHFGENCRTW